MTEVWIVEQYDYGEGTSGMSDVHGVFSTREKAEAFVARSLRSFPERSRYAHETTYGKDWNTEVVSVYSKTIDAEDEQ